MITPDTLSQFRPVQKPARTLLKEIAAISSETSAKKGDFVFREGEKADKLHFLLNGSIALRVKLTSRPDSVTVSFVSMPYQSFGWSGVVAPHHYTSSAECDEDSRPADHPGRAVHEIAGAESRSRLQGHAAHHGDHCRPIAQQPAGIVKRLV
jgi:CRP-like cAMP-binding protein